MGPDPQVPVQGRRNVLVFSGAAPTGGLVTKGRGLRDSFPASCSSMALPLVEGVYTFHFIV